MNRASGREFKVLLGSKSIIYCDAGVSGLTD